MLGAEPSASSTPRPTRWPPGTEGLLFAPYLAGRAHAARRPDARGAFTGLSLRHDRGALARAVLEGVAYGLRDSLELLRALGVRARRSAASPAAARAASSGRGSSPRCSTCRSSAPSADAGSAFGAALLAGVRAGVFADAAEAVARCVRVRERDRARPGVGRRVRARATSASARSIRHFDLWRTT